MYNFYRSVLTTPMKGDSYAKDLVGVLGFPVRPCFRGGAERDVCSRDGRRVRGADSRSGWFRLQRRPTEESIKRGQLHVSPGGRLPDRLCKRPADPGVGLSRKGREFCPREPEGPVRWFHADRLER